MNTGSDLQRARKPAPPAIPAPGPFLPGVRLPGSGERESLSPEAALGKNRCGDETRIKIGIQLAEFPSQNIAGNGSITPRR
ncbi:hypothetical protein AGOR_G00177860 [Albula goreensis]|uniref:Uncharacterized protein n=1 Tax=Albula goreensis TaxID=1534307 RepID=A0A8T3CVE4_9TELE|nr:hypothetical protein AGOR_G00177860 [Albula goreensis]